MERKTPFLETEFYHVYNRGVDKRIIFSSAADYKRFLALLYIANSTEDVRIGNLFRTTSYDDIFIRERGEPLVAIGAFCLMPNHFHLLVTPILENGLSRFMLKLQTGYSMYFNIKNERTGALFQGAFKAEHADEDAYLKYLFSYIHLNPAKLKDPHWKEKSFQRDSSLRSFVEHYPYSSLREYLSEDHIITNPEPFPDYFPNKKEVWTHVDDWLRSDESKNPG